MKLDRTSGFRVKRPEKNVGETQLTEQLDTLRDQRAAWTPVDGKPMPGDQVTVNLATAEDGGAMSAGKEYRLVIGEGQAIAAIEELILEAAPGQTIERPVKWPDDFPDDAQRAIETQGRSAIQPLLTELEPATHVLVTSSGVFTR